MDETEPKVSLKTVQYAVITYGSQKLVVPVSECTDIVVGLSKLLPDDAGSSK